jgi:fermentation-respiration switch protein FrsA (DUF1100 family)
MKRMLLLISFIGILLLLLLGAVYVLQDKLIFFPEKVAADYKYPFQQPFEEVFFDTPDLSRLHALWFRQPNAKGVILYFHGNAGSLRSWGYIAEDFLPYGYEVFIPDYRSFGKSTGHLSETALHQDAQLTYDYLQRHYPEQKIIIFGRSIGTGIATRLAAHNHPRQLILESPFYNFTDVAKAHYGFLPVALLLKYSFRSDEWIRQVPCPVYILHGTADAIVPFSSGQKLARLLPDPEAFIPIEGGGHNDLSNFKSYQLALKRLLP